MKPVDTTSPSQTWQRLMPLASRLAFFTLASVVTFAPYFTGDFVSDKAEEVRGQIRGMLPLLDDINAYAMGVDVTIDPQETYDSFMAFRQSLSESPLVKACNAPADARSVHGSFTLDVSTDYKACLLQELPNDDYGTYLSEAQVGALAKESVAYSALIGAFSGLAVHAMSRKKAKPTQAPRP